MNPEFDSRRSKNGGRVFWLRKATSAGFAQFVKEHPPYDDNVAAVHETMSGAAAAVVADRGDEVRVGPGYTLTLAAPFCLAVAGVRWVGEGSGTKAPEFTVQNARHGISIDAAGVEFENFRFAAPLTDEALSMIKVKGAGVKVSKIVGIGSAGGLNFVDCIIVGKGANDFELNDVRITSSKSGAPVGTFLRFESPTSRFTSAGFFTSGSVGTAGVIDDTDANVRFAEIKNWSIGVGGSAKPAITLDADGSGIVRDSYFAGTHTTIASNAVFSGDFRLSQVYVSEEVNGSKQGALIPAVDAD